MPTDIVLSDEEKLILHKIARMAIENSLKGENLSQAVPESKKLQENRGAFVSLHRKGRLRGCIGYIHAVKPLYDSIREMAISAAFQDPRFEPLKKEELCDLDIELSVLTPMKLLDDIKEIEIGKHGLMIVKDRFSGLLLPQVASEYKWDRETFLGQTCIKAGLPLDSWKDNEAKVYIFSAEVF